MIFEGRIMQDRPKDSHDILGAYHVTNNRAAMQTVPENFEEFLQLIKKPTPDTFCPAARNQRR